MLLTASVWACSILQAVSYAAACEFYASSIVLKYSNKHLQLVIHKSVKRRGPQGSLDSISSGAGCGKEARETRCVLWFRMPRRRNG